MIFWLALKELGSSICNDMKYRCFKLRGLHLTHQDPQRAARALDAVTPLGYGTRALSA